MNVTVIKQNQCINMNEYDKNQIYDIVKFIKKGMNFSEGRTCYYILRYPIIYNNVKYYSVKIKGAGFYNQNNEVIVPGESEFVRKEPHYGFDDEGKAIRVFSDVAPFGGIVESKAINEYNNFEFLTQNDVSTLLPYALLRYEGLFFGSENLAVVIALSTEEYPIRMYKLLWSIDKISKSEREYYSRILKCEHIHGDIEEFNVRVELIQRLAKKYTAEIKKFSQSGLYIHSGGWSNIQYNSQTNNIVLVDLDSSRFIPYSYYKFFGIYSIRDFISNIYRLLISLYNPNIISQYDENMLRQTNYIFYLLYGYFPERSVKELQKVSNEILDFYIKNCFNKIKEIEYKMNTLSPEEVKKYELSMFDFYDFCLKKLHMFIN